MFLKRSSVTSTGAEAEAGVGVPVPKTEEEILQEKIEKRAAQQRRDEEKDRIEQLEFFRFPNIMGWYFDGTFTKDFTLHEEYAEYFNDIEDEQDAQKDLIIEETFTEKAYRNFWPPLFYGGKYFRTRGIYLDLKEVKEDPPRTPPNINYEKQRGIIGVDLGELEGEEEHDGGGGKFMETYGPAGTHSAKDNWYWNGNKRDFKPKEIDGDYIWCDDERIWREQDSTYRTPYDWYFDEKKGQYFIRDLTEPELYEFDNNLNIYKRAGIKGPAANGMRHNDYFYDEKLRKWLPITKAHGHLKIYPQGNREIAIGDRGKSGLGPDDYYYDAESGKMEVKDEKNLLDYYYDTQDKMFKKKGQPYGPGKTNLYPTDYEFDLKLGKYNPKPAKECRKIEPYDFYYDKDQGKFFRRDRTHREKYEFDTFMNVYKLKDAKGPPINELTPEQYYWNEKDREWKLTITVKDQELLEYHEPGKRKILQGDRGKSGKVPDDFYYDAHDGSFFRKDMKKLDQYWYDTVDEVWKKRGQHHGPGYFQLNPWHYYFDYDEGFWYPTATAKSILAKGKRGETKGLSDLSPYDYAFSDADGEFQLRDTKNPRGYEYNPKTGVFHVRGGIKPANADVKVPKDFFFDENTCTWLPLEHPKGHEARDYRNGKRNNRAGTRGKSGKIPDDYYFSFASGEFKKKEPNDTVTAFEYVPDLGVWKHPDEPSQQQARTDNPNYSSVPQISDYYFDKEEGAFVKKTKLVYGEIYLNPNTNLWMQRWRCPLDYYWESRQNKYLRKPATMIKKENDIKQGKTAGGSEGIAAQAIAAQNAALRQQKLEEQMREEERKKREARDYDRPWLHNFLTLAADEIRFEQELLKQNKNKHEILKQKRQEKKSKSGKSKDRLKVGSQASALSTSTLRKANSHEPRASASTFGDVSDTMSVSESGSVMSRAKGKKAKEKKHGKKGRVRIQ